MGTVDFDVALFLNDCNIVVFTRLYWIRSCCRYRVEIDVNRLLGRNSQLVTLSRVEALSILKDNVLSAIHLEETVHKASEHLSFLKAIRSSVASLADALPVWHADSVHPTHFHCDTHGLVGRAAILIWWVTLQFLAWAQKVSQSLL